MCSAIDVTYRFSRWCAQDEVSWPGWKMSRDAASSDHTLSFSLPASTRCSSRRGSRVVLGGSGRGGGVSVARLCSTRYHEGCSLAKD